jgi:flavorubredoxin
MLNVTGIDYLVCNHAEQDHSGAIPDILDLYPQAKVVTNEKCKRLLEEHLPIDGNRFVMVQDEDTLSLGDKTLKFVFTPWVHWPETMCTYLMEDKILFSGDFFGSHLATSDLCVKDEAKVVEDAKRYYAEIMMPFRMIIRKNIEKLEKLDFEMIAPSHGPVYNKPDIIMDAYMDWISDRVENTVVLPYVSMHGSTQNMVEYLEKRLIKQRIAVKPFNLPYTDLGQLAMSLVNTATIVMGTSTVLTGPHPAAVYAATLVNALRPKAKFVTVIGSYGWGGKTVELLKNNLNNLKSEWLTPVMVKGFPEEEDYRSLDKLANTIKNKHKDII